MSLELLVADSLMSLEEVARPPTDPEPAPKAAPTPKAMRERVRVWERKFAAARAPNTLKAVRGDWQTFLGWCERANVCPLPVSTDDFLVFLNDMVVVGRKRATLNRYVYTVREIHKAAGAPDPCRDEHWALEWAGIVRKLGKRNAPRQAAPLKQSHVEKILASLGGAPRDLRDAALITLASDTLCRESELVAVTLEMFHQDDDGIWTLELGETKTDQEGIGSSRFVSSETKARIDQWCQVAGISTGYIFLPVGGRPKRVVPEPEAAEGNAMALPPHLRPAEVAVIIRRRAQGAGIANAARVSGHSARVGSTIDMLEAGFGTRDAQYAGGWKTERMVLQYGKQAKAGRNAMAQLRAKKGPLQG